MTDHEKLSVRKGLGDNLIVKALRNDGGARCKTIGKVAERVLAYSTNLFLACLDPADMELLRPHLHAVRLEPRQVLMSEGKPVQFVYFPLNVVISLSTMMSGARGAETAAIGRDGVLGVSPALDSRLSLTRAIVQIGGQALACDAAAFKKAVLGSPSLLSAMMRHEHTLFAQSQQTTACATVHKVYARLARSLLRMRDLTGEDLLSLTHHDLAASLGVRRTSITESAQTLQKKRLISYSRGKLQLTDSLGLREAACECYGAVKRHYLALHRIDHMA